jgi:protein phosphatase
MYEIAAATDIGLARDHNEDGYLVNQIVSDRGCIHVENYDGDFVLAAADGVGGKPAGEVASRIALEQLIGLKMCELSGLNDPGELNELRGLNESYKPVILEALKELVISAHRKILEYSKAHPQDAGLCTTLTGIASYKNRVLYFHTGNSRVYRFRSGFLRQITTDQTLVQAMVDAGKMSYTEASVSKEKNILLNYLGGKDPARKPEIEISWVDSFFDEGDVFLLTTDGLHDLVDVDTMEACLVSADSLDTAVKSLIEAARQNGGYDNVTAVAVKKCK